MESSVGHNDSGSAAPVACRSGVDPRRLSFCICAGLVVLILVVFAQTGRFGFVNFDDPENVYDNPVVSHGITWRGLGWAFTHCQLALWIPLTTISHMADCHLFGMQAGGHHLVNVLLHTASTVLLFLVLRRMTGVVWPSAFAAAVFAIHPLRVESVAWVTERKDVLSGLFFMLMLAAYERYVRRPWSLLRYVLVVVPFALGLLSKPMLVTAPFVLLLLDCWPLRRAPAIRFSRLVLEKLPLLALSAAAAVTQMIVARGEIAAVAEMPLIQRVANAVVSYSAYLGKTFYPAGLAVYYPHPGGNLGAAAVALSLLVLVAITVAVLTLRRRAPWLTIGWLWYLGTLVPVIGILQAGELAMADRYTYLPQIGLCIAVGWSLEWMRCSWHAGRRAIEVVASVAIAALTFVAWRQTSFWRSSETLWTRALACTSKNSRAHYNLGVDLSDRGRNDEAIAHFRQALAIKPADSMAHNNLGAVLAERGEIDEAVEHYRAALEVEPGNGKAHNNLGFALLGLGKSEEAIVHCKWALKIDPENALAHNNLGLALAARGQADEAIEHYRIALEIKPDHAMAHNNLAISLAARGRIDEAFAHYRKALEIMPGCASAHYNLGMLLASRRLLDEAIVHYRRALEIKPGDAEIHNNLGLALAGHGQIDAAIIQFRKAIEFRSDYPQAHNNLGYALAGRGEIDEAIAHYWKSLQSQPDNTAAYVLLGDALAGRGKLDEALAFFQQGLALASSKGEASMADAIRARIKRYQSAAPTGIAQ